ncbi:MAG TPA: hypothetical protein VFR81_15815 [Longimicrobium sp.]|nr:hypothetical protein [Longimicrobium sp.]
MHRRLIFPALLAAGALLPGCADRGAPGPVAPADGPRAFVVPGNPHPSSWGPLAPPTLLAAPRLFPAFVAGADSGTLEPAAFAAVLRPGETVVEHKTARLPASPPRGDVVFSMDLTGSMGGELNNMKVNAVAIMNAVGGVIPDVSFGVTSYEDYAATYSSCGYFSEYGFATDRPFRLSQGLTANTATVAGALSALTLGFGSDGPESYGRALYETYAELTPAGAGADGPIGWRPGARRIVVNFADNVPHDCDLGGPIGLSITTGADPGRDGVTGTADDLPILDVMDGMSANNVTLINLFSSPGFTQGESLWSAYAARTGGTSHVINGDGSFPGGIDIATAIADLIRDAVGTVGTLTIGLCPGSEAFAPWLVGTSPASYTNVALPATLEFDVEFGPPPGTPDGLYTFALCSLGDGAVLGRQEVAITVRGVVDVGVDIKPFSNPNSIRLNANGDARIAVAILRTPGFDPGAVSPSTVTLGDGSGTDTPVATRNNGTLYVSTSDADGDGDLDLVLHFSRQALLANGDLTPASTHLVLRGALVEGTAIQGSDAVRVLP